MSALTDYPGCPGPGDTCGCHRIRRQRELGQLLLWVCLVQPRPTCLVQRSAWRGHLPRREQILAPGMCRPGANRHAFQSIVRGKICEGYQCVVACSAHFTRSMDHIMDALWTAAHLRNAAFLS